MPPARLATKSVCEAIGVKPAEVEMVVVEDDVLVVVVNAAWSQCLVPVRTISSNLLPVEVETVVEKVIPVEMRVDVYVAVLVDCVLTIIVEVEVAAVQLVVGAGVMVLTTVGVEW